MFLRTFAIVLNTYREAVRARILHGLLGLALCTNVYSLVLGSVSLHQDLRVIANIGAASVSFFSVLVAIVLGATSLHRELELKTIFPILTRRLRRHEYVLGKFFGLVLTLTIFAALDGAVVLIMLAAMSGRSPSVIAAVVTTVAAVSAAVFVWQRARRTFVLIPAALVLLGSAIWLADSAGGERQLMVASLALTVCEVAIVTAVALLFSSFSSPFLTAILTLFVFIIGRSADTLANLPARFLGSAIRSLGTGLAAVFPNLHLFVPPRPLLLGLVDAQPLGPYVLRAFGVTLGYVVLLVTGSTLIFRRRDFT
jgi:Cu-processing system permease protein